MEKYTCLRNYLLKTREERRAHLNLSENCLEIGGDSRIFRGMLAHFLMTRVDYRKALACHACNNDKCSNPRHMYWGSAHDNYLDQVEYGTHKSVYELTRLKYKDDHIQLLKKAGKLGGMTGGGHNRLTDLEIQSRLEDFKKDPLDRGKIARLSKKWNISHTQVARFLKKYAPIV